MIEVGIIGGAGYTAGELIRLLLRHPQVEITFVQSNSQAGKAIHEVHPDLLGEISLFFLGKPHFNVDLLFLCQGHERAAGWVEAHKTQLGDTALIDLSRDFRLSEDWCYGLPELNLESLRQSRRIANPGCFATALQLALLPLASRAMLQHPVHIQAITGSTGAGQQLSPTGHFSWRAGNVSVYKAFQHQHLPEIQRSLLQLQEEELPPLYFVPVRGNFTRGIFATLYTQWPGGLEEARALYQDFFAEAPFVHLSDANPTLKQVLNTNKAMLHLELHQGQLFIVSIIDNLLKGAAGQAVQNLNIMQEWPETCGLQLKPSAF